MIKGIHKEGKGTILIGTGVFIVILSLLVYVSWPTWVETLIFLGLLVLIYLIFQFFRIPNRNFTISNNQIICPADGKVVVIEDTFEEEYLNEKRKQVSIFMSPLNVHIQWYPISGKVVHSKYHPGKYLVAWHPKSSTENERHTTVVENEKVKILFRQIAGAVARRIVSYAKTGIYVRQGEEAGFIKFGSRVDVFVPINAKIKVNLEEKVRGGVTVLAEL